ncbi:MAG: hypothetical protein KA270_17035 [Saprospiraceae bacterium]|jgi:hypothetical protein|nr:hypothetical protein [Saprospiraceae bacterium]MBP6568882.1 hypothetical protein [Saprospiraceae bacterium]MBP9196416.1 hypothetical protein [Saprospiraceae bacterium]
MKVLKIVLGPELYWVLLYMLSIILAWANKRSNFVYDDIIENVWFYIPVISVMIFGLYWIPIVEKNWLMARIWISGIVMGHFVLETLLESYSQQGPGIGMGYLAGMLLLFFILLAGSIVVKLVH